MKIIFLYIHLPESRYVFIDFQLRLLYEQIVLCFCLQRLSGNGFVGFNNSVFLAEKEVADRNYALAYYMKENKCFPKGFNLQECLDFYFQVNNFFEIV